MDLDLNAEQEQLVDAVRSFLTRKCPADVVRDAEPVGFDADLWAAFAPLAGPLIGLPEEQGGGGASLLDLELVGEQVGAFLAPVPFVEDTVAGADSLPLR